jgi:hypothetical protein
MYRVRRIVDGKYLRVWTTAGSPGDTIARWSRDVAAASVWTMHQAATLASAMIVIGGDPGIEIDPVDHQEA